MPSAYTQDKRFLKLSTTLGPDALLIESFTVSERLSDYYVIEIEALGQLDKPVDPSKLLGQVVTITVSLDPLTAAARYFTGIVW
jgi:uncharacterized protein involved in type VI secretion and phage assembly